MGKPARILDLGCGAGYNVKALRVLYPEVEITGIDLYDTSQIPELSVYRKVDLDLGKLPFPDEHFDSVIITHVLEHLAQPLKLASEMARVLKKGGIIYIETPNWTSLWIPSFGFRRAQGGPFNFYDDPTHLKPWSPMD